MVLGEGWGFRKKIRRGIKFWVRGITKKTGGDKVQNSKSEAEKVATFSAWPKNKNIKWHKQVKSIGPKHSKWGVAVEALGG